MNDNLPAKLKLAKVSKTKTKVTIYATNGAMLYNYTCNVLSPIHQSKIIEQTGLKNSVLLQVIEDLIDEVEIPIDTRGEDYEIRIRGIYESSKEYQSIFASKLDDILSQVLFLEDFPSPEPIAYFNDERICILDVDYHAGNVLPKAQVEMIALSIRPTPSYWWISHGGGCKLIYNSQHGLTAKELASVAAYSWRLKDKVATFELCNNTRLPRFTRNKFGLISPPCMPIVGSNINDIGEVKSIYNDNISDVEVLEILEKYNFKMGESYPHDRCLIDPSHVSTSPTPVKVGEHGVYCFSCAARGKPGLTPYATLVAKKPSKVLKCIKNLTHWAHAKYVVQYEVENIAENILNNMYSAALKAYHGVDDKRIPFVFSGLDIIRVSGNWVFDKDSRNTSVQPNKVNIYKSIPRTIDKVQTPTGEYKYQINNRTVETISHVGRDMSDLGYDELHPVKGMTVYGVRNKYPNGKIPIPDSFTKLPVECRPKYIGRKARMSEDECKQTINGIFPGVDFDYLYLLLVAKGWAEGELLIPTIMIAGASGAAKTTTISLAAGILGDVHSPFMWESNEQRLRQHIMSGLEEGSFVSVNEVFKNSEKARFTPKQALDPILNLTPETKSHKLYIGSVPLGKSFVCVFTDIELPLEVKDDVQLSRRIIYYRIPGEEVEDWRKRCLVNNISHAKDIRMINKQVNHACDSLVSHLIDNCFAPGCGVEDGLNYLGMSYLRDSTDFRDSAVDLKKFVKEMCQAADSNDEYKPEGRGWKMITNNDISPLRLTWDAVADAKSGDKWASSRRASEYSWGRVHPGAKGVQLDRVPVNKNGEVCLFLRFRLGQFDQPAKVNAEIFLGNILTETKQEVK